MIKNAVVVGFGSAGKRHYKELLKLKYFNDIYIVTKQKLNNNKILPRLEDIKCIKFSYIVICSETYLHYEQLKFIENSFKNKIIVIEKPLFHKHKILKIRNNNKIFIAYNLRLNPCLLFIKKYIKNKKIYNVRSICCSNLVEWRNNRNR